MARDKRSTSELFDDRSRINTEINDRAWQVLIAMGYDPYRKTTVQVARYTRGVVEIYEITAEFEQRHQKMEVKHEVPEVMFERLCGLTNDVSAS